MSSKYSFLLALAVAFSAFAGQSQAQSLVTWSFESLPANMTPDVLVLRRGQVMPLGYPTASRGWNPFASPRMGASVSASAFSTGSESVSISQNGNEILIEMSLPDLEAAPIRYRGTAEQIEQQVRNSNLSPAARQRVLDAIR